MKTPSKVNCFLSWMIFKTSDSICIYNTRFHVSPISIQWEKYAWFYWGSRCGLGISKPYHFTFHLKEAPYRNQKNVTRRWKNCSQSQGKGPLYKCAICGVPAPSDHGRGWVKLIPSMLIASIFLWFLRWHNVFLDSSIAKKGSGELPSIIRFSLHKDGIRFLTVDSWWLGNWYLMTLKQQSTWNIFAETFVALSSATKRGYNDHFFGAKQIVL